jgi:hypothetical protein
MVRRAGPIFFLAAVMILAFWKPIFHRDFTLLGGSDMCAQTFPWLNVASYWLKKGVLLLWDPYVYSGKANLGELQPGILYPLNWLVMLIPSRTGGVSIDAIQFLLILNYLLAAYFAYLLARSLGLSTHAGAVAAITFSIGGYQLAGWVNIFGGFIWLPLIIFLYRKALLAGEMRRRPRWLLWTAIVMGISLLAGHHAAPVHAGLLLLFYTIYRLALEWKVSDWRKRATFPIALACVGGAAALLTAAQWLPSVEWARLVLRWVGAGDPVRWGQKIPYGILESTGNLKPQDLVSLVLPYFSTGANLYVGATALFLCLLGLLFARRGDSSFFRIAFFIYLLLSLGSYSTLHGWVNTLIPGVWFAREVYLYLVPLNLCLALMAGWGLDALRDCFSGERDVFMIAFIRRSAWAMALLLFGTGILMVCGHIFKEMPWDHAYFQRAAGLCIALMILGLSLYFLQQQRIQVRSFSALVVILIVTDLSTQQSVSARRVQEPSENQEPVMRLYWEITPAADFLRARRRQEIFRVDNPANVFPENFGDSWLLEETMGHGATALVDYLDFRGIGWSPASNASALLNNRYVVSRVSLPGMKKVFGEEVGVYRNPRAVPRAFVTPRYRGFERRDDIPPWIRAPLFAPEETVLLAREDLQVLPLRFLEEAGNEEDTISAQVLSSWMASEREAGRTRDEEKRHLLDIYRAPWGWSTGDELTVLLRPARRVDHCYLLFKYIPVDAQTSRLFLKLEGTGRIDEIAVDLPGLQSGEAVSDTPRRAVVDLGALANAEHRLSFTKTVACGANLDAVRISSSLPTLDENDVGEVHVTQFKPNRLRLQADLKRPAFVVVSEVHYPGWEATVDGKTAPLVAADYVLKAIPVPAGKHEIILRFRPRTFIWGLTISLISLAGLILALVFLRDKEPGSSS